MRLLKLSGLQNLLIFFLIAGAGFPHPSPREFSKKPPLPHFTAEIQIQEIIGGKKTTRRWEVRSLEYKLLLVDSQGTHPRVLVDFLSRKFVLIHPKEKMVMTVNPPPLFLEKNVMWIGRILAERGRFRTPPPAVKKNFEQLQDSDLKKITLGRPPHITEVWIDRETGIPVKIQKQLPEMRKVTVQILQYDSATPVNPDDFLPPPDFRQVEVNDLRLPQHLESFLASRHLPFRLEKMEARRLQHFQMKTGGLTRIFYVSPDGKEWAAVEVRQNRWDAPIPPLEHPLQQFRPLLRVRGNEVLEFRTNIPFPRSNRLLTIFEGFIPVR